MPPVPEWATPIKKEHAMASIARHLGDEHRRSDDLFLAAQTAVNEGDWGEARARFNQFRDGLEHHLRMEEDVLLEAFDRRTGGSSGPTLVMRNEHRQILGLVRLLDDAILMQDVESYLGNAETLKRMLERHNMQEEGMLYLMCDRLLSGEAGQIIDAMESAADVLREP